MPVKIKPFFDKDTATFTYVVSDIATHSAAVIDSVLNYDQFSGRVSTYSADEIISYLHAENLKLEWILETHIHADHLTAARYIKKKIGGKIGIGSGIKEVLKVWIPIFNTSDDTDVDASQFDVVFEDNAIFHIGETEVKVLHTPGHTPACVTYYIDSEKLAFVGDTIFMPDLGTARTDFPGGSAQQLYNSVQRILSLPHDTKIFACHDYPPQGREVSYLSTVKQQKIYNVLINDRISQNEYVSIRNQRDEGKQVPKLLFPAIQVNLRAGEFGNPEDNGSCYIKIPIEYQSN